MKDKILYCLTPIGFSLLGSAGVLAMLFLLAKGAKCETMGSGVVCTCAIFCTLVIAGLMVFGLFVAFERKSPHYWLKILGLILCGVLFFVPLVFIPPWQKIVPNVQNAYAEYKAKYPNKGHTTLYDEAEFLGNHTLPLFNWLAERKTAAPSQPQNSETK